MVVSVDGRVVARGRREDTVRLRRPASGARRPALITALDERGRGASTTINPVFSLPAAAEPRGPPRRRRGSSWPARSAHRAPSRGSVHLRRGPAHRRRCRLERRCTIPRRVDRQDRDRDRGASQAREKPTRGSRLDALLRKAIIPSDDQAANDLLTWLGGSTSGGAAYVTSSSARSAWTNGHVRRLHRHEGQIRSGRALSRASSASGRRRPTSRRSCAP